MVLRCIVIKSQKIDGMMHVLQVPLPNNPPWFNIFDVTEDEINDICLGILKLYARPKVSTHVAFV